MKHRFLFVLLMAALSILTLFAFGSMGATKYNGIKAISIGTANVGGVYYVVGAGMGELFQKRLGISVTAEVTAGSLYNAKMLHAKKMDIAIMTAEVADAAIRGKDQFDKPQDIKAITTLHPGMLHIVALARSNIKTFQDLKGKKVSVGPPGSGANKTNELIMGALGYSFKDRSFLIPQFLSMEETTEALKNGSVDATLVATGVPAGWIMELETTHPVRVISLNAAEVKKITDKVPFYKPYFIKTGIYKSLKEDCTTVASWNLLTVRSDLPDDLVYDLTSTFFENIKTVQAVHSAAEIYSPDNVKFVNIGIHPGALKYYKEKRVELP